MANEIIIKHGDITKKVVDLVLSATRSMPARFTGDDVKGRKQTFGVNFSDLTADDEAEMATAAFFKAQEINYGFKSSLEYYGTLMIGEDAMIGAYILTKFGNENLVPELRKIVITERTNNFIKSEEMKSFGKIILSDEVIKFFIECSNYGIKIAKGNK
jgi:hypothetical protein